MNFNFLVSSYTMVPCLVLAQYMPWTEFGDLQYTTNAVIRRQTAYYDIEGSGPMISEGTKYEPLNSTM